MVCNDVELNIIGQNKHNPIEYGCVNDQKICSSKIPTSYYT